MKAYLKKFGFWEIVINPPTPSNKNGTSVAQKEAKKDNTTALKFLMDGLPSSVKESVGENTSAKDLWFKLEREYQQARPEPEKTNQESEDKPPEELNQEEDSRKGMNSCDYNDSLCDEIEKVLADNDEGISKVSQEIHLTLLNIDLGAKWFMNTINMNHSDFTKFKKKILDSLNEYQQNTMTMKVFLVKLKHKDKELQDQMKDKDVEVKQIKNELISQKEEPEEPVEVLEET